MIRFLPVILAFLLVLSTPLYAAEINDSGSTKLKTMFSRMLEDQKKEVLARGSSIETVGEIVVEQADTYYAVTMPELEISDSEGGFVKIGMVSMNVTPTEKDDEWKMSLAIPTPIILIDENKKEEISINIGSQKAGGVWSEKLNNFSKLVANYNDITIGPSGKEGIISISKMDVLGNLSEDSDGLWSGPTKFNLEDIRIKSDKANDSISINNVQIDASVNGFDIAKQQALTKKLQEQEEKIKGDMILAFIEAAGKGSDFKMTISDLKASSQKKGSFSINNIFINSGFSQAEEGKINTTVDFGYNGLTASNETDMTPEQMKFDLNLKNIPLKDLIEKTVASIPSGTNEGAQRVAALQMMMTLPQLLAQSGMTLQMNDTKLMSDSYQVRVAADFAANANSPVGFAGAMNMSFDGLDETLTKLEAKVSEATPEKQQKIKKSLGIFKMVQQQCPKSGNTYDCEIAITNDAKFLLNGQDASPLLMGGMGATMGGSTKAQPPASQ